MKTYYSVEKNVQILIALLKAHKIRKIVASPGSTNICFVASVQNDPYFEMYSCVDERSAGYMACGIAAESGEPVVISCTGATASRNYIPALTEAYYRKLPVIAVTSTRSIAEIGQNIPQVMDRTNPLNDIAKISVYLPYISGKDEEWECNLNVNRALLEARRHGGGPVHINLMTKYREDFSVKELPEERVIRRVQYQDKCPKVPQGKIGIFVGSMPKWSAEQTEAVEKFCENYNAVVLYDPTSNYKGKYGIMGNLIMNQHACDSTTRSFDLIIHIGDVSGAYMLINPKNVWRIHPDGEVRDTFKKLTYVFEMNVTDFFRRYNKATGTTEKNTALYDRLHAEYEKLRANLYENLDNIPFSNPWIATQTVNSLPEGSVLHLAILNSLRNWSFIDIPESVLAYSNVGGFGIDGCVSSMIGASLCNPDKIYYCVVGDLAFFYDLNSIGNRHVGSNIRILLINNGIGNEFKLKQTLSIKAGLDSDTDPFIAATGHYGNKSPDLVRHYAQDLGFEYLTASGKEEYLENLGRFTNPIIDEKPILFEVFTDSDEEVEALLDVKNLQNDMKYELKQSIKDIVGKQTINRVKQMLKGGD
ncbi:MAG: 2-succinyl-5-enolpyruvyl-6-hydroxy-3-cyclohexene-1-carboxylate synthase [Ruminococcus sp.]|nr:2-succinyl-5-enolpyruvyl-6-hydroxy-3-cyclohexene-1-carboxylate synthase [Ruminococcus sp.]